MKRLSLAALLVAMALSQAGCISCWGTRMWCDDGGPSENRRDDAKCRICNLGRN